jgi:thioesterase domain-containing protein
MQPLPADDDRVRNMSASRRALFLRLKASRAQTAGQRADHPVIPLRSGPGPARLVLLHPSGGALFCYTPLVRALRPDIDVLGFAADPADRDVPVAHRMEVVAGRALAALAALTDPARCVLAGWSHGGALAFEMARQHEAATGGQPAVALLDCSYYGDVELDDDATLRRNFAYDFARLVGRDSPEVRAALMAIDPMAASLRALLDAAQVTVTLTDAELADKYQTFRSCALALESYCPAGRYGGQVTLLVAEQADAIAAHWRKMITGPFSCVRLPGDHYTLFTPPILPALVAGIHAAADALAAATGEPR